MSRLFLLALILLTSAACWGANFYVDCYATTGDTNPGTSFTRPWRRPLQATVYSNTTHFNPDDHVYFRTDGCVWQSGLVISSSGTSGHPILYDTYSLVNGLPVTPGTAAFHFSGQLPVAAGFWTNSSGNLWQTVLYAVNPDGTTHCGALANCVKCYGSLFNACLDQPLQVLNKVRFAKVFGSNRGVGTTPAQNYDWNFDPGFNPLDCDLVTGICTCAHGCTQTLTVYSSGGNPATAYGAVVPIAISGEQTPTNGGSTLISIKNAQWLQVQHFQLDWYDSLGLTISDASDHIWIANGAANSMVENGETIFGAQYSQLGFWANLTAATDIHLWNVDADMNYDGFEFGAVTGCNGCLFDLQNCRAYGNRLFGLVSNVTGAGVLTHDYCHFYGNNLGISLETDFGAGAGATVPVAAAHDVVALTPPWIMNWKRWPALVTWTFDDCGLVQYSCEYLGTLLPLINAIGITPSVAVVTGQTYSPAAIPVVQGWINAGSADPNSHSNSHGYTAPPAFTGGASGACSDNPGGVPCDVFKIQYSGTVATQAHLTVTHDGVGGGTLTISTFPDDAACDVSWNLKPVDPGGVPGLTQIDTVSNAISALLGRGNCFTLGLVAYQNSAVKGASRMFSLADVSNQDIWGAPYSVLYDEHNFELVEFDQAQKWLNANFTGLPVNRVAVMPFMFSDPQTQVILAGLGYKGIRGTGSSKPCCGNTTTLANGYNVFDMTSQGTVPNLQNLSYDAMRRYMLNYLWKDAAWGNPMGFFMHLYELPPDQVQNELKVMLSAGATFKSNTQLMNLLLACNQLPITPPVGVGYTGSFVPGSFYTCPALATGAEMDFRPTVNSPTVHAGANLGSPYNIDMAGNARGATWDIGAYQFVPQNIGIH